MGLDHDMDYTVINKLVSYIHTHGSTYFLICVSLYVHLNAFSILLTLLYDKFTYAFRPNKWATKLLPETWLSFIGGNKCVTISEN